LSNRFNELERDLEIVEMYFQKFKKDNTNVCIAKKKNMNMSMNFKKKLNLKMKMKVNVNMKMHQNTSMKLDAPACRSQRDDPR
jgi:predicted transcriptional regulator